MTTTSNRNPYVNECRIQTHTHRSRVRAWSESTTTSLLSSTDSITSTRAGSTPLISVSAVRRPLPEIPAVQSPLINGHRDLVRTSSVCRTGSSKNKRHKRAGSESRRNTLIYLSIASVVFSLFCLSLLAAMFFRHGILPWDDVAVPPSSLGSCRPCVTLLQTALRCQTIIDDELLGSSAIDAAINSKVSERISNFPTTCSCRLMKPLLQLGENNVQSSTTVILVQDSGHYMVFSRSEVQLDHQNCLSGTSSNGIEFLIYRRTVDGTILNIAQSIIKTCELNTNDKSVFCIANAVDLDKGDVVYTTLKAESHLRPMSQYLLLVHLT